MQFELKNYWNQVQSAKLSISCHFAWEGKTNFFWDFPAVPLWEPLALDGNSCWKWKINFLTLFPVVRLGLAKKTCLAPCHKEINFQNHIKRILSMNMSRSAEALKWFPRSGFSTRGVLCMFSWLPANPRKQWNIKHNRSLTRFWGKAGKNMA